MLEIDKITSSIKRKPINAYIFMTCVCLYLLNEACFKHIGEGAADKKLDSDGGYYDVIFIRAETKSLAAV